jgi:septal ring factor EnvC (AmiA/AmiB activator)
MIYLVVYLLTLLPCSLPLESLAKANKRADDLASKLGQSEKAREKAEQEAASVGDLRKRLHQAKAALNENISRQTAREEDVIGRLESQNRRFVSKLVNPFARIPSKISSSCICR